MMPRPPRFTRTDTLFPYTTLFRSLRHPLIVIVDIDGAAVVGPDRGADAAIEVGGERSRVGAVPVHHVENAVLIAELLRSEEHTSELQSLMRISYAVFCLKKKKKQYKDMIHKVHL